MSYGSIYTVAGDGQTAFSGDFGPATSAGMSPAGVALDSSGNLVIPDFGSNRIRVVAESSGTFYGITMTAGDIYTVAGHGQAGFSGDGGPALQAGLDEPSAVAVDAAGNLVIGDRGNARIRVVAKSTGTFYGLAMKAGDIYTVAGNGTQNYAGDGGPATSAELDLPSVALDGAGNLIIVDNRHNRVRLVAESSGTFYGVTMTAGDIYTVAGNGTQGSSGDGGPAAKARLNRPGMAVADAAGDLIIADSGNNLVRLVTG